MNNVQLIGTVGKGAEIKEVKNGKMALFSIATTERYKDKGGEQKEITDWHNVVSFTPHIIDKCAGIEKGVVVFISGKIKYSKYTDKNGVEKTTTQIHPDILEIIQKTTKYTTSKHEVAETVSFESSDLPF